MKNVQRFILKKMKPEFKILKKIENRYEDYSLRSIVIAHQITGTPIEFHAGLPFAVVFKLELDMDIKDIWEYLGIRRL